jgi:hypothetical protein
MIIHKKEGLKLLTSELHEKIEEHWNKLAPEIFTRDGTDKYGINIVNDQKLQENINGIYKGLIPAFAEQVWQKKQTDELQFANANYMAIRYANSAVRQLHIYLKDTQHSNAKTKAAKLVGSIISRAAKAFNQALLDCGSPFANQITVYIAKDAFIDPDKYQTERYRKKDEPQTR